MNLPPCDLSLRTADGREQVYDFLRRRWVALTPEEHVRQCFTHFLVEHKGYPQLLMQNEVRLEVNGMTRRADTVLYDVRGARPRAIVEYKAPDIALGEKVIRQVAAYCSVLKPDVVMLSNGITHYALRADYQTGRLAFLPDIPAYEALPQ